MRTFHAGVAVTVLVVAAACSDDRGSARPPFAPGSPAAPWPPVGGVLTVVSGENQHGKAGEPLAEPFVVKVTDRNGAALANVSVSFNVTSGAGALERKCDGGAPALAASATTDADGFARMTFEPTTVGRTTVTATIVGATDTPATFTVETTIMVIQFWFGIWYAGFLGPCPFSNQVTVPVGTPVEWSGPAADEQNPLTFTVTSTASPPGAGFDSGTLQPKQRFRFVPVVPGTWEYMDRETGLTGAFKRRAVSVKWWKSVNASSCD